MQNFLEIKWWKSTSARNTKKNDYVDIRANQIAKWWIYLNSYKCNISFQLFLLK